jgi:hypothetical protein
MGLLKKIFRKFFKKKNKKDQWFIALKYRTKNLFNLKNLTIIHAPKGHFWADPFVIEHQKRHFIFFEDHDYVKANIGVAELKGLELINPRTIIKEKTHISFPAVFKLEKDFFMTIESIKEKKLYIYKAIKFPDQWKKYSIVARGQFVDPVIKKTTKGFEIWASEGSNRLKVFHSKTINGPWKVIRDEEKKYARSAGHFIRDIRPVQDCTSTYGGAIKLIKNDKVIKTIKPNWAPNITGTHTFNFNSKYVVIDGKRPYQHKIEI